MDYRQQVFNVWAPANQWWTSFAKPVLFYSIEGTCEGALINVPITYMQEGTKDIAVIIDIPGDSAVAEAVSLAKIGFRPVPLFNGNSATTIEGVELVDTTPIKTALCQGAEQLSNIQIEQNAPPAFILDSNRLIDKYAAPGMFDNRWNLYAHDFPSAEVFKKAGIRNIIVRNNDGHILADLAPILFNLQKLGIEIYISQVNISQNNAMPMDSMTFTIEGGANGEGRSSSPSVFNRPTRIQIRQPGFFSRLFGARTYSTRSWNSTGGWGSKIPCHGYGGKYGGGYRGGGYGGYGGSS